MEVQDPRYAGALMWVMVRALCKNGTWAQDLILSTLAPAEVLAFTRQAQDQASNPAAVLLAYAYYFSFR